MSPLNCWTTYKDVANGVSKFEEFCSLLSDVLVSCKTHEVQGFFVEPEWTPTPPHLLNPFKPWFICWHKATALFFQWVMFETQLAFVYCWPCSSLWFEISTLAYEANSSRWPERLSVVYCTHIIQTKVMIKNRRYPQISMSTATDGPTGMPLVVLG